MKYRSAAVQSRILICKTKSTVWGMYYIVLIFLIIIKKSNASVILTSSIFLLLWLSIWYAHAHAVRFFQKLFRKIIISDFLVYDQKAFFHFGRNRN